MSLNEFAVGIGAEARKQNERKVGAKVNYFRMKNGESARVQFIGEPIMFAQHGDYNAGIKSHACIDPRNNKGTCPSCARGIKRANKTMVFLYNFESKQVEVAIFNKREMGAYYGHEDNYGLEEPVLISVKGEKTEKVTTIGPIPPKRKLDDANIPGDALEQITDEDFILRAMFVLPADKIERLINGLPLRDDAEEGVKPTNAPNNGTSDTDDDDVPF